jgi:hypothetical protein
MVRHRAVKDQENVVLPESGHFLIFDARKTERLAQQFRTLLAKLDSTDCWSLIMPLWRLIFLEVTASSGRGT